MTLIIILFSAIVPLIVYLKPVLLDTNIQILFSGVKFLPDFFNFYKSVLIVVSAILGLLIFFYKKEHKKIKIDKINIIIIIYMTLIILSTTLSDDRNISLFGFYNLYEGCFVLISYLLMFYFSSIIDNKKIKTVFYSLIISATTIGLIGIAQFFGFDIFNTSLIRKLTMPTKFMDISNHLEIKINKYSIYSTLLNPNYVGSYMSMIFPISVGLFIYSDSRKKRIFSSLFCTLMFINLLGSGSKAGYLGVCMGFVATIILFKEYLIPLKTSIIQLIIILGLSSLGILLTIKGTLPEKINTLYNSDIGNQEDEKIIEDMRYINNGIHIKTDTEIINILLENDEISFYDNSNQYMGLFDNGMDIKIDDYRYKDYTITFIDDDNIILLNKGTTKIKLIAIPGVGVRLLSYNGDVIINLDVKHFGFKGRERFASSRGYIWSRSIPMLRKAALIGYGPDNFVLSFPQDDIVGKYKIYGTDEILVNKPHNMYLQIAINTGLLSLICFLIIIISYMKDTIKSIRKNNNLDKINFIKTSIFVSIISYLIAGFFNDSFVGVAPIFWTLLGIGVNLNKREIM